MKKARYTSGLVLLILLASIVPWPMGEAITPQDQTISITDTHDDKFITEAGIGIDAWLCHILDPEMDIRSYLVFRELEINYWEPLKNATLRLRTTATLDFEADSSVTVYGMKYSDLQDEGIITPSFVLSVPYTSASVTVNTSQFYGQQWHEVNVTNIVEELIRSYEWDGDGHAGVETGDSIGFVIVGAEGYDTRWFIDYHYGTPSLASQLVIHWNHEPPPPTGYEEYEYVEEYGNFTIWRLNGTAGYPLEPMELIYAELDSATDGVRYDTIHSLPETPVLVQGNTVSYATEPSTSRSIVRQGNGVIHVVYWNNLVNPDTVWTEKSLDNGATWIGLHNHSTVDGMKDEDQNYPCIAVDSIDDLHVLWMGKATGYGTTQIWHNRYNNLTETWDGPERISTYENMSLSHQWRPSIAVDSDDNLHVVWHGKASGIYAQDQIFYTNYTDSWATPMRISNYTDMDLYPQAGACIALDRNDALHVTWDGPADGFTGFDQIWYVNYTTSWLYPYRISTAGNMHLIDQGPACIALDSENDRHVVFQGATQGSPNDEHIFYANGTIGWTAPIKLSDEPEMAGEHQNVPVIAIDSDDVLYAVWSGLGYSGLADLSIILSKYTNSTTGWCFELIQYYDDCRRPNVRWATWPTLRAGDFIVVDENGTVVQEDLDTLEDAEDWIDTEDPDPEDPDPAGEWSTGPGGETGAFTRFRMRLWFLLIGFGCLFGPILFFAWKRPSGYYILCGAILMLVGIGMLLSIGQV